MMATMGDGEAGLSDDGIATQRVATPLVSALVTSEQGVFAVRRQARAVAAALGLGGQDQIRAATALSEVCRRMLDACGHVSVAIGLDPPDVLGAARPRAARSALALRAWATCAVNDRFVEDVHVTKGLMDRWEIDRTADETAVSMWRAVPEGPIALRPADIEAIRADVARLRAGTPMEELAEHNRQLLATLEEVQRQRDDLLRLNTELEETNSGVMALYTELSEELEATNRGVVALYAELDQRTTQARAASEAKTRFLGNVSHELRSPVTSIVGLTRLLRDPSSDPLTDDQTRQLELIDASAHSLLGLVNELLDLAKAESGRLEPRREPTDLQRIFTSLRGTSRAMPISDETSLVVDDPVDVPTLYTDPIMLTQVLRNLLTNGIKFTPSGTVRMTATDDGDGYVSLEVSDTGIGIPASEQERVFEEFHQVRSALQATTTGTGLGLPYARRLVEILDGTIELVSTPEVGSTFTVRLPVGTVPEGDVAEPSAPITVLVVDDDEAFRTAAAGVLRGCGFTVAEIADGRAVAPAVEARRPDIVLLDLRLEQTDGFVVLDTLTSDDNLRTIPVVMVTAYPQDLVNHPAARRATAVLDKTTITLDDLCEVVRVTVLPGGAP
jgi:signal transduction histidine kinase